MSSFELSTHISGQGAMAASWRGIQGLSELIVLDEIINRLKNALKPSVDLLPADDFDMIWGTSTGGRSNQMRAMEKCARLKYGNGHGNDRMLMDEEESSKFSGRDSGPFEQTENDGGKRVIETGIIKLCQQGLSVNSLQEEKLR
ncbi:uncharacterized protein EAF01_010427 [Botrytis porri]|uniref:Uncharacterized protein n=1 Tax=Botrytis porri TaxID=87229 RepID=A0A4Z1KHD8_9HELO|nr:uncharacterized protein EAF01_010427 [Botrytis porri]KAF7892347.1 hypothetical protein EAF01_010427 [Botrytis porri]TGO84950.1 hypothetical protein BPOR_0447g00030 [Botrytis porri]